MKLTINVGPGILCSRIESCGIVPQVHNDPNNSTEAYTDLLELSYAAMDFIADYLRSKREKNSWGDSLMTNESCSENTTLTPPSTTHTS